MLDDDNERLIVDILTSTVRPSVGCGITTLFRTQDPDVLAVNHGRELHADLSRAWERIQHKGPGKSVGYYREVEQA